MNEKPLLILCYLITTGCILSFRKRLSKRQIVVLLLLVPIAIYILLMFLFVALALIYGDK